MREMKDGLLRIHSTKKDGNMTKKYSLDALENRKKFIEGNGIDLRQCLVLGANNSDSIVLLDEGWLAGQDSLYDQVIEGDAVVCTVPGVMLYLNFGDCLPFTIYDKEKRVFAFAHLGWKSVYLDLHKKLVDYFKMHFDSNVEDLVVYVGPSIKKESYVFLDTVQAHSEAWVDYVSLEDDGYHVDLSGYVRGGLISLGLLDKNIDISPVDTGSDLSYFSNYRSTLSNGEESSGRFFYGSMML